MPQNAKIIDWKPKSEAIVDYKPKNELIVDWKPKNETKEESLTDQLYSMTLGAGMWLGISALTYPTAISITSPKSP